MKPSPAYRYFLWGSAFLFLANLLVANDLAGIWDPWEAWNILHWGSAAASELSPTQYLWSWLDDWMGLQLFWLRLPSALILFAGFAWWYYWGKSIFGKRTSWNVLLVMASSFALLFCGKLAVNDAWLLVFQWINFLCLIRFLKGASHSWAWWYYLTFFFGAWIHPWSMVVFCLIGGALLRFFHPDGKVLDRLWLWLFLAVFLFTSPKTSGFVLAYGHSSYWQYLLILFLGLLPWTGFLVASLADLVCKLRRGEEMALISCALLIAALAAQSLVLTGALALLIARQLSAYFQRNYPFKAWVKGFAILHLLCSFFLITYFLLSAYAIRGGVGFRSAMAAGAIYWMLTFIGVLGLYSFRPRLVLGGMAWGGMLGFLLFWIQVFPILESDRIRTEDLVVKARELDPTASRLVVVEKTIAQAPSLEAYCREYGMQLEVGESSGTLEQKERTVFITDPDHLPAAAKEKMELKGSAGMLGDSLHLVLWK